jgi:DNA-3-methyladenine glycosylase
MGIDRAIHNNQSLTEGPLFISGPMPDNFEIVAGKRIGINVGTDLEYRYTIQNNIFVSK